MATITVNPGDNIVTKVSGGAANDLVVINAGTYRTTAQIAPKSGMTIQGASRDTVLITIAKLVTGFTGSSPRWTATVSGGVPGPTIAAANQIPSGGFLYPQSAYAETIYVRNTTDPISTPSQPLWKVGVVDTTGTVVGAAASTVGTTGSTPSGYIGTCHINYQTGVVTISVNPSGKTIEVSNNKTVINITTGNNDVDVSGVTVAGSTVRGIWANGGYRCVFHDGRSYNNHIGVGLAGNLGPTTSPVASATNHNGIMRRWEACYNGQYGFNTTADFPFIDLCKDTYANHHNNHLRLFNTTGGNFASGGCKCSATGSDTADSGVHITSSDFHDNWGTGCWLDLGNMNWGIDDCVARDNSGHGFHIEINYAGEFTSNYVYDNTDNGVFVSTTQNSVFYNNYVSGNGNWQIRVLDASRGSGPAGLYRGINNTFGGTAPLQRNFVWHEGAALTGFQTNSAPDSQVYSTNSFTNNKHYLQSPESTNLFQYGSGTANLGKYAGWQSAGFDVGISAGTVTTPRPVPRVTVDPPVAPTVTATAGGNSLANNGHTLSLSATFTFSASGATSYEASIDGAAYTTASSPLTVSSLAFGNHTVAIRGVNDAGAGSSSSFAFVVDPPAAPTVTATDGTNPLTNGGATQQATAVFTFSTSGATAYQANLDGAGYTTVASPLTLSSLSVATHTILIRGTNASGVGSATTFTWTVQATSPPPQPPGAPTVTATVSGQPFATGSSTTQTSIIFTFSSSGATSYQRSLDGAAYGTVTSPQTVSGLSAGAHTYAVRAVNADGTSTSTTFSWTVTVALPAQPTLTATVGGNALPNAGSTTSRSIDLAFSASGATSYQASVDGASYTTVTSPRSLASLAYAAHTFSVRGVNSGGTGPTATYTWTVFKQPPRHWRAGGDGAVGGTGLNVSSQTQGGTT